MKPFNDFTGTLELVLGSAWLSRFELGRLKVGDYVLTDRIAGTGFELRFNGTRLADAETFFVELKTAPGSSAAAPAVPAGRLAAGITNLGRTADRNPNGETEPLRGNELTALLPVSAILGRSSAALRDLSGLGPMSLIELGIGAYREGNAWRAEAILTVAGMEAGRGVVSVSGEYMALELTALSPSFNPADFSDAPFASTGRVLSAAEGKPSVKRYDFSKPDCFTRRQIDSLAALHEDALRAYRLIQGEGAPALRVSLVDQLNFTEYLESLDPAEPVFAASATATVRPFMNEEDRPAKPFFAAVPLTEEYPVRETTSWAQGLCARPVGGSILLSGPLSAWGRDGILEALRDAWRRFGTVSPRSATLLDRPSGAEAAAPAAARYAPFTPFAGEWEMIVLVELAGESGTLLRIVYPLRVLEPVLRALDS